MSDEQNTSAVAAAEPSKKKVSDRFVLNAQGAVQDEWADAHGFSYKSIPENYELKVMFDDLPKEIVYGLAAFGGLTLAGNTTNTVRNDKNTPDEDKGTEKDALMAWYENLKAGNWTSPRGEVEAGLGSLAEAYSAAFAKEGVTISPADALVKLKEADKDKRAALRKHPQVKAELTRIIAERAAAKAKEAPVVPLASLM